MSGDDIKNVQMEDDPNSPIRLQFDAKWGAFRRFIAANPLTGFWCGVIFGAFVAALFLRLG